MTAAYAVAALVGVVFGLGRLHDYDIWWHVRTGDLILDTGRIPTTDPFSYSSEGKAWIAHEWAFDVLLALAHRALGPLGIIYLQAALGALTVALLARLCRRWGGSAAVALLVAVGAGLAMRSWFNGRPLMMLPIFIALELDILWTYRQGRRWALLWLPPLFVVWVNFHGGFVVGFAVLAIFAFSQLLDTAGRPIRVALPGPAIRPVLPVLAGAVIAAAATLANPYGVAGALYPFQYFGGQTAWSQTAIAEFRSPDFHATYARGVEVFLLVTIAALAVSPLSPSVLEILLLLAFTHIFLIWLRNGPLLVAVAAPILARSVTARLRLIWPPSPESKLGRWRPALLVWAMVPVLATWVLIIAPRDRSPQACVSAGDLPARAAEVVRINGIRGPMFNTYKWGGYLIYALWPEHKVFMDGRADLHGEALFREYEICSRLRPGWREVMRKWDFQWALVDAGSPFVEALGTLPNWALIYSDGAARLFLRTDGVNRSVYKAYRQGELALPANG